MKAIAAYRRTLAIDSENVTAHFGLAQAYNNAAWGRVPPGGPARARTLRHRSSPTSCSSWRGRSPIRTRRAGRKPDANGHPAGQRRRPFMKGERPKYQSRLEPLHDVVEILGPAWDTESSDEARTALARRWR